MDCGNMSLGFRLETKNNLDRRDSSGRTLATFTLSLNVSFAPLAPSHQSPSQDARGKRYPRQK